MMITESNAEVSISAVVSRLVTHAQVYHVRCSWCDAVSVAYAARDSLCMICPNCKRQLMVPATVLTRCSRCRRENTSPHHLAGHSSNCAHCGSIVSIDPLIGRTVSRHRLERRPSTRNRGLRTLAFADGAERSLLILAAAIVTLIFLFVISL